VLHEQNSVVGMANKYLAKLAKKVYTAFPGVMDGARWIGNPLRKEFAGLQEPAARYTSRRGPLRILVLGGSLGARALNEVVPKALASLPAERRPMVIHQSGKGHLADLRASYDRAGVQAELTAFLENTATAMANADLIICRAGASTVTEIAAVGTAAVFVPFPAAVDDHQTSNAMYLVKAGGGWLVRQQDLTPQRLTKMLSGADRPTLQAAAVAARKLAKWGAAERMAEACEKFASRQGAA
jgi:UDP-N-acetylglucosamine--N-acetylmuramyl-(pentapeptide) pyrophosphoryl-undecaprenol N-acetylglucosamine transferase